MRGEEFFKATNKVGGSLSTHLRAKTEFWGGGTY